MRIRRRAKSDPDRNPNLTPQFRYTQRIPHGGRQPPERTPEHHRPAPAPPAPPPGHVPRVRLLNELDTAVGEPVTLLCAPAGWGKSTLIAAWAHGRRLPGRTVHVRFEPGGFAGAWRRLRAQLPSDGPSGDSTTPVVVVLDDLHTVTEEADLRLIERLILTAGPGMRFVIVSRTDPPLSLYRWRLKGELTELRADRLAFTVAETAELLDRQGVRLAARQQRILLSLTEGWPVALVLATQAMRGAAEPTHVIDRLVEGDPTLAEYLRREVMQPLSADARDVLVTTSILEAVSPGLVDAMGGRADGARVLADLSQANALLVYCGGVHSWYRYRRLLRTFLRGEAARLGRDRLVPLHRAASEWYAANGLYSSGLRHALYAGEWTAATDLLHRHWPDVLSSPNRSIPFADGPAPPEERIDDPALAVAFAAERRLANDPASVGAFVRMAERAAPTDLDPATTMLLHGARLSEATVCGDPGRAARAGGRLLAALDDAPRPGVSAELIDAARGAALTAIAGAAVAQVELDRAEHTLREALPLVRRIGPNPCFAVALRHQGAVAVLRGQLGTAGRIAHLILQTAADAGVTQTREIAFARVILAEVCVERGLGDEAEHHVNQALHGCAADDGLGWLSALLTLARAHQLQGDARRGAEALEIIRDDVGLLLMPAAAEAVTSLIGAELHILAGDHTTARQRLREADQGSPLGRAHARVVTGRLDLHEGNPDAAADTLEPLVGAPVPSLTLAVEVALLYAQARHSLGDPHGAARHLERALRLAHPESIRRPFLVNAGLIGELLAVHRTTGGNSELIAHLTTANPDGRPVTAVRDHLIESLTDRELIVLRYLRSMLSTAEIAGVLNVSTNTVKTHVKNVYRKLGVGRRRDAVRRANELQLL